MCKTVSFSISTSEISHDSILAAVPLNLSNKALHAIRKAFPFKSAPELAAVGDVLATLVVLVDSIFILSVLIEKIFAAT